MGWRCDSSPKKQKVKKGEGRWERAVGDKLDQSTLYACIEMLH
jgi:hypothetical protein